MNRTWLLLALIALLVWGATGVSADNVYSGDYFKLTLDSTTSGIKGLMYDPWGTGTYVVDFWGNFIDANDHWSYISLGFTDPKTSLYSGAKVTDPTTNDLNLGSLADSYNGGTNTWTITTTGYVNNPSDAVKAFDIARSITFDLDENLIDISTQVKNVYGRPGDRIEGVYFAGGFDPDISPSRITSNTKTSSPHGSMAMGSAGDYYIEFFNSGKSVISTTREEDPKTLYMASDPSGTGNWTLNFAYAGFYTNDGLSYGDVLTGHYFLRGGITPELPTSALALIGMSPLALVWWRRRRTK